MVLCGLISGFKWLSGEIKVVKSKEKWRSGEELEKVVKSGEKWGKFGKSCENLRKIWKNG